MSLFRRERPQPQPPAPGYEPVPNGKPVTFVARGTIVRGSLTGAVEVLIEGEVEGEIRVDAKVVVGAQGVVRGPVAGDVVLIAGRVNGDVRGADRVEVAPSGSLEGDISAPRIVVAEGAFFKGKVEMQANQAGAPRSSRGGPDSPASAATRKD
jgi:cytoskeletal protein CcmA (bactofilin family)